MLRAGGEIHVTLPFPPQDFRASSVELIPGSSWAERFERVLAAAASVFVASDHRPDQDSAVFAYANLIQTGLGLLRARTLGTPVVGLAEQLASSPSLRRDRSTLQVRSRRSRPRAASMI